MMRAFGWIFLVISVTLLILQLVSFWQSNQAQASLILIALTLGSLAAAIFLFRSTPPDPARRLAGAVGLGMAVIIVLLMAINAVSRGDNLNQWEYVWLFGYAFLYAAFGLVLMRSAAMRPTV